MSGLLIDQIKSAILTGHYRVRQRYRLLIPESAAGPGTEYAKTIHNNDDVVRVIDNGVLVREAFNQTIASPGKLVPGIYQFTVENADGFFLPDGEAWYNPTSEYQALPTECRLWHSLSVYADAAWVPLVDNSYTGKILGIEYKSLGFVHKSATISSEIENAAKLTGKTWNEDDFDEIPILDGSLDPIVITGPVPGEN